MDPIVIVVVSTLSLTVAGLAYYGWDLRRALVDEKRSKK